MRENKMKQILDEGKLAVGMGIFTGSPIVVQMIGYSGFDFVFIDMEHTPKNLLIRAVKGGKAQEMEALRKMTEAIHGDLTLEKLLYPQKGDV